MAKSLLNKLGFRRNEGISKFKNLDGPPPNATKLPGFEGIFWSNKGTLVHKWHHYLPIYEKYFSPYREANPKFLEIGVSKGGSLALWRKYFGSKATIFGIDRDQACQALDGDSGQVRIGSQDDPDFLKNVVSEMGGVDIILDDGSHISKHIRASLETLFPLLSDGGIYMIEDLHATYWKSHHGGYQENNTFINDIRQMYDDMHHWYHSEGQKISSTANSLSAIHLYDSIAVLEKNKITMPKHSRVGSKS